MQASGTVGGTAFYSALSYAQQSQAWASQAAGTVDGTSFSAKYYALLAAAWAYQASGTVDGTHYSAYYWAQQAAISAAAAAGSGVAPTGTFAVGDLVVAGNTSGTSVKSGGAPSAVAKSGSESDLTTGTLPGAQAPVLSGDVTTVAGSAATMIAANAVTNAKVAQMAAGTLKGNLTGSTANAADNTLTAYLDAAFGSTQGSVLMRGASAWALLPPGTAGQVLTSGGAGANPSYAAAVFTGLAPIYFGDGSDGNVTISSGTVTLTHDMYYANLTISGTGSLVTAGFKVFVSGTLTLTNSSANAISAAGNPGGAGNASGVYGNGGASLATTGATTTIGNNAGQAGGTGSTSSGSAGGYTSVNGIQYLGGSASSGGVGGAGSYAAGVGGTVSGVPVPIAIRALTTTPIYGSTLVQSGLGGPGGGAGSGNGSVAGGGGGGGGGGGSVLVLFANTIARGASTAAGAISAAGGAGGVGGAVSGSSAGSGGGGSGGGGGAVFLGYATLTGTPVSNLVSAAGGTGGNSPAGSGTAGGGGAGGGGGFILVGNLSSGAVQSLKGSAASAASGGTGGVGGACSVTL